MIVNQLDNIRIDVPWVLWVGVSDDPVFELDILEGSGEGLLPLTVYESDLLFFIGGCVV